MTRRAILYSDVQLTYVIMSDCVCLELEIIIMYLYHKSYYKTDSGFDEFINLYTYHRH